MTHRSRWTFGAAVLTAVLVGFVATSFLRPGHQPDEDVARSPAGGTAAAPTGVRTTLPGLTPATGEPTLSGFETARPPVGTVAHVSGPFDERYTWSHLRLDRSRVSGDLRVTSDVSDLLDLEVLVGFYDAHGRLLDTGRFVRHHSLHEDGGSGVPDESVHVVVDVPQQVRGSAVAAAVGVPVLVNE